MRLLTIHWTTLTRVQDLVFCNVIDKNENVVDVFNDLLL